MTGALEPASPLSVGSLAQLTLSLLAIVGLILALGWLLRKLKFATPRAAADMRIVDELSIGPRERIALVRIGDAQVLVGISAGGIVALAPLEKPITIAAAAKAPAFADRLREFMKNPGGR